MKPITLQDNVEYEVYGEKWIVNGIEKQVYIQRFVGIAPKGEFGMSLVIGLGIYEDSLFICGNIGGVTIGNIGETGNEKVSAKHWWGADNYGDGKNPYTGIRIYCARGNFNDIYSIIPNNLGNHKYKLTFKYTKH